jgi:hypothetical protein
VERLVTGQVSLIEAGGSVPLGRTEHGPATGSKLGGSGIEGGEAELRPPPHRTGDVDPARHDTNSFGSGSNKSHFLHRR